MTSNQNFQVDLGGIIELLSDHLYSGPDVYLRELIQNAVDALAARKALDIAFVVEENPIQVEVLAAKDDGHSGTLVLTDRGIGLTETEIHKFLATIGQSSKRTLDRTDFIGQFGIGLLSGFIISDEIVVITKSVQEGTKALEWRGRSDGTYSIRELEQSAPVGTQVYLRPKDGSQQYIEGDTVRRLAKRYASHLKTPIEVIIDGEVEHINVTPPWEFDTNSAGYPERCLAYGEDVFGQKFVGVIPFESESGGVDGLAFITPHASRDGANRRAKTVCISKGCC